MCLKASFLFIKLMFVFVLWFNNYSSTPNGLWVNSPWVEAEGRMGYWLACVAWRFCRAGRTSGQAAKERKNARTLVLAAKPQERAAKPREKVAPAPISSRFLCPRPPLLLSAPNQKRHATQASYWIKGHEGERNNCFSKIQLVGQKYRELKNFS